MNTTLTLATLVTLSLGGTAMADGPTPANDYWGAKNLERLTRQAPEPAINSIGDLRSFRFSTPAVQDAGTVGGDGPGG
jgi:hypothetical protein